MSRPSIVLIFADQWRADTHSAVLTPHLATLRAESTTYATCLTNAPLCRPARVTLMTGQPVHVHGYSTNHAIPDPLAHPSHVRDLREAGYRTALIGKSHLTPGRGHLDHHRPLLEAWGFQDVVELPDAQQLHVQSAYSDWLSASTRPGEPDKALRRRDYLAHSDGLTPSDGAPWRLTTEDQLDTFCARTAAAWLRAHDDDTPFYVQVNFPGPHPPFDAPRAFSLRCDPDDACVPPPIDPAGEGSPLPSRQRPRRFTDAERRALRTAYFAKVALVDQGIGQVVDALRSTGRLDDTWVIVTADHGELLGDHGLTRKVVPYEGALRVPLVVRPPGGTRPHTVTEPVDLIDIVHTLRAIADVGPPKGLLDIAITPRIAESMGLVTARSATHKLVYFHRTGSWVGAFDLEADPREQRNLIDTAFERAAFRALRTTLGPAIG